MQRGWKTQRYNTRKCPKGRSNWLFQDIICIISRQTVTDAASPHRCCWGHPSFALWLQFPLVQQNPPKPGKKDSGHRGTQGGKGSSWPRATGGLLQHPAAGWDPEELLRRNARRGPSEGNAFHIIFSQLPSICCFGTSRARGLSPDLAV